MFVDKEKLFRALIQPPVTEDILTDLYWGLCLRNSPILKAAGALYLNVIGSISIPISLHDIDRLIKEYVLSLTSGNQSSKHKFVLPPLPLNPYSNIIQDLTILALTTNLGCNIKDELKVDVVFKQLMHCTAGSRPVCTIPTNKIQGTNILGTFLLQIPVEGGYTGGRLRVEKPCGRTAFYDFDHQSDQFYYCAIFFSGCKFQWEPVERGNLVALQFDIVWRPPSDDSALNFPTFVTATKLIKESLITWNSLGLMKDTLIPSKNSSGGDTPTPKENPQNNQNILFIPIWGNYIESDFSFSTLRGQDRQTAQILQSIGFIDVNLAIVTWKNLILCNSSTDGRQTLGGEIGGRCRAHLQVVQWIDSSGNTIPSKFQKKNFDFQTHVLGLAIKSFSPSPLNQNQSDHYPVLVIQPRCQSASSCTNYQLDAILDLLETQISSDGDSKVTRPQLLSCLGQTIFCCQEELAKVWNVPADQAAERTLRLLKICKSLEAQSEGLQLIETISKQVPAPQTEFLVGKFDEGVGNELLAQSIVDLVVNTGGWQVFRDSVLRLITPSRVSTQLRSFACMIVALVENGCLEGAMEVARKVSTDFDWLSNVSQSDVDTYVDAIIALYVPASNVAAVGEILLFLHRLPCFYKCQLLIDLQKNNFSRLRGNPSCLYKTLAINVLEDGLTSSDLALENMKDVVDCYLKLGDRKIVEMFIDSVLWRSDSKETNNLAWLKGIIQAGSSLPFVKAAVVNAVKKQIPVVRKFALKKSNHHEDIRRSKLARFFLGLLQLEQIPQLASPSRLNSLSNIYLKMPVLRLNNLIIDLIDKSNSSVAQHLSGENLLLQLGRSLLLHHHSASAQFPGSPFPPAVVNILRCFVDLRKLNAAHLFVRVISDLVKWDPHRKMLLIGTILSSPEIWSSLMETTEATRNFALTTATVLMSSWIDGLIQMMEKPAVGQKAVEEKQRNLRSSFAFYFINYIRQKKQETSPSNAEGLFSPFKLVSRMSARDLVHLIWDIHQWDLRDHPSLKNVSVTLELYTDLCRLCLALNLQNICKSDGDNLIVELAQCLLWLGDENCLYVFTSQMLASQPVNKLNDCVLKTSECIRKLIRSLPSVHRDTLCRILEQRLSSSTKEMKMEASLHWQKLPGTPAVMEDDVQQYTSVHRTPIHEEVIRLKDICRNLQSNECIGVAPPPANPVKKIKLMDSL